MQLLSLLSLRFRLVLVPGLVATRGGHSGARNQALSERRQMTTNDATQAKPSSPRDAAAGWRGLQCRISARHPALPV